MSAKVSTYMNTPVYVVRPQDTLSYARNIMLSKSVSRLVVVDDSERPVGVITVSDIADIISRRVENTLDEILVREVMTRKPIVIEENSTVKKAAYILLKNKIGGLPVVDKEGRLTGIITRTDIAKAFSERYRGIYTVEEIARREVSIARGSHSISYIIKLINADPSGKVVIVDENMKPIGVIAKRDIALLEPLMITRKGKETYRKYKAETPKIEGRTVTTRAYIIPTAEDVMTPNPITAYTREDAAEAVSRMVGNLIGCLPVVDENGVLRGILTKIEVLAALALGKKSLRHV
ncbi:MAG: CBS domain-containing protein [Acidilobaceae archaeon]